jgi:hypothetical protein
MAELTDRGISLGSLQTLSPVLEEWLRINEDWEEGDAAWWYNERTVLGILAGAVWRCQGRAIEEFLTEKRHSQKRRGSYPGRCDMVFGIGEEEFWCEAKQCWSNIGNGEKAIQKVRKNLEKAVQDVKKGIPKDIQGLAIVFVVPIVKVTPSTKQKIDEYIANFIELLQQIEGVTLAWTFPQDKRNLDWSEDDKEYFPGGVLVLKPVD